MKKESSNSILFKLILVIYRTGKKLRWYLAEKRLKWQRPKFYNSLGLYQKIHFAHLINPFLRTIELDATIFAYTGEKEKLKECLERGVSPDLRGLMENAIFADNASIAKLILAYGANPDRKVDLIGHTLLHEATRRGSPEIVELLLAKGADPNRQTQDGKKPLYYAYDRGEGRAPLAKLLEPVTKFDRPNYNVDDFLKMEDQVKAYYAFCKAIMEGFRTRSPAELRVLALPDFLAHCCMNGFNDMYWQARWAVIPSTELMEAIGERKFAEMLRKCIAIAREYGEKIGRDPFGADSDYVDLDEETEKKFDVPELDFCKLDFDWDEFCRKTMNYVRENRELFA
ncbi:MAG TPA: ankyrin repeat domain-containing protein [Verrucomicrobiae bacterium]|nr:ankyrin repeat domain-containing protein [Verrucomicrobiae bacterium]